MVLLFFGVEGGGPTTLTIGIEVRTQRPFRVPINSNFSSILMFSGRHFNLFRRLDMFFDAESRAASAGKKHFSRKSMIHATKLNFKFSNFFADSFQNSRIFWRQNINFLPKYVLLAYSARHSTSNNVSYRQKRSKNIPKNVEINWKSGFIGTQKGRWVLTSIPMNRLYLNIFPRGS